MTCKQNTIATIQHNARRLIAAASWRMPDNADWQELPVVLRLAFGAVQGDDCDFDAIPPDARREGVEALTSAARSFAIMAATCEAGSALLAEAA